MGKCVNCQSDVGSQAFCKVCGEAQVCSSCNQPYEESGKFCTNCGASRKATAADKGSSDVKPVVRNKKKVYVGVGIVAALFLLFLGTNLVNGTFLSNPEKTVQGYFDSLRKGDVSKASGYLNPSLEGDYDGMLSEMSGEPIKVQSIESISKTSSKATLDANLIYKEHTDEEDTATLSVELSKVKGKWYIDDMD